MPITPTLARMITEREPVESLRHAAGFVGMQQEAIEMALDGRTSLAEAQRVVFFESPSEQPKLRVA
jgi:type II secretory ATPase GspE/PulE/Tfp pilus assembly ATPase PilB-like protein